MTWNEKGRLDMPSYETNGENGPSQPRNRAAYHPAREAEKNSGRNKATEGCQEKKRAKEPA